MRDSLVGEGFDEAGLEILPLRERPSLKEVQTMDLAPLHEQAQISWDLPQASEFFSLQNLDVAHFLVWLPPNNGEFHQLNLSDN